MAVACKVISFSARILLMISLAGIYLGLIIHKGINVTQIVDGVDGQQRVGKLGIIGAFRSSRMTPTLHLCLRDAGKHSCPPHLGVPLKLSLLSVIFYRHFWCDRFLRVEIRLMLHRRGLDGKPVAHYIS